MCFCGCKLVPRFFFLILLLCTKVASAESLEEVVVTATRIEVSLLQVPRSMSVVGKDQIQNGTQQLGLDEALAGVPGLYMQGRYNYSQDLRIALRGFGARSSFGIRGIRIYVDDIPESLPDGQAQVDSIDLGSAQQIEVLRGPSSSLYGNASGGVISVTSELGSSPGFVETTLGVGELGYERYQLKVGGATDTFSYLLNASRREFDGYRDHSGATANTFNGKFSFPLNDTDRIDVSTHLTDQPISQDPGGINASQAASDPRSARDRNVLFDAGEALSQQRLGLAYRRNRNNSQLLLRGYAVGRDFSNLLPFQDAGAVDLERFFTGFGVQYSRDHIWVPDLQFIVGLDIDRQDDDRRRFDNIEGVLGGLAFDQRELVSSVGAYGQIDYQLSKQLSVQGGLRFDSLEFDVTDRFLSNGDDSGKLDFNEVSPSASVSYQFHDQHQLFASLGRSFETPTTTELANPNGSGGFNPNLDPQVATNFEVGLKGQRQNFTYEVATFRIDLEDELVPFELQLMPGRTFFSNAGESSRTGLELGLTWTGEKGMFASASYTYSNFEFDQFVDDDGNNFSGNTLPGLPESFGYVSLGFKNDTGLRVIAETSYSGSLFANNANTETVASYVVTNIRLSHQFDFDRWNIQPYIGINNLFDEEYNNNIRINAFGGRFFEPAPERNTYGGVTIAYQLKK